MANKLIGEMGLPIKISNIFAARNIITAKDALSMSEFELMELLDVGMKEIKSAITLISEATSPPCQSAQSLLDKKSENEHLSGHLPTHLKGLDETLRGGIPFGVLTELVGPPGIGKSQFCMKLALPASFPAAYGGLDGRVVYIDVESKFSSRRVIEMGLESFPEVFHLKGMAQEMAGRILVLRPTSLANFTERDPKPSSFFSSIFSMGKEGKRLKRCSTSTSTDVEAADHKGSVPLQKAEREPQIDLEPTMKHKKKTSKKIKEMKKLRKTFKEMIAIMKNLEEVFMLRADPPWMSLKEGVKEEVPREKTEEFATYECNFETEDSNAKNEDSVLVYNLDTSLSRDDLKTALRKHFKLCGCQVTRVYVPIECLTGVPLGFAFVDVDDKVKAIRVVSRWMGERNIIVVLAEKQPVCWGFPNFSGCRRCGRILMKRRRRRRELE